MALLDDWKALAYDETKDRGTLKKIWDDYFIKEKETYQKLLSNPDEKVTGTVKELAERFDLSIMDMTGFLDGINESLVTPNPVDTMEEDTEVSLEFDNERLYKNMVRAGADWLYDLPEWESIFDEEKRAELYKEEKTSHTYRKTIKVGRNDPCPCGSGKKYKQCCMKKDQEEERKKLAALNM